MSKLDRGMGLTFMFLGGFGVGGLVAVLATIHVEVRLRNQLADAAERIQQMYQSEQDHRAVSYQWPHKSIPVQVKDHQGMSYELDNARVVWVQGPEEGKRCFQCHKDKWDSWEGPTRPWRMLAPGQGGAMIQPYTARAFGNIDALAPGKKE